MTSPGIEPSHRPTNIGTEHQGGETEQTGQDLGERAKQKGAELKGHAERAAEEVRDRARSMAADQKSAAAGRMSGIAHALRSASDDLEGQGQPMVAEYSRYVAKGLESMADSLGRQDLDDLVGSVEEFARSRPVAFLGGAVVAGFALARFMKSSSARRYEKATMPQTGSAAAGMSGSSMPGAGTYGASAADRSEQGGL
jgi:hypothetical protein